MATARSVLRRLAPAHGLSRCVAQHTPAAHILPPQQRGIFNLAAAALGQASSGHQQTLTTTRTLPYAAGDLFRIVADINAYAQFLPHCTSSRVTHWRPLPSDEESKWPSRADLTVGWGPISQTYSSRVYCVPGHGVVEAVSGRGGAPTLSSVERVEIGLNKSEDDDGRRLGAATATDDDTFESLVTRWKVQPLEAQQQKGREKTRVELHIQFQFRNPLYQIAAARVGNEMATKMIEAFEARAAALLAPKGRQL
ncbi:cyclase dehydrase [Ophiostoma piceae UAMH 11346]|uniref:Cyclase dehydrase n=1 Tax=Ophiostoma piceae (strain UAMH 11346) TaxID=1262450 RepID=S3CS01_OPHP1|nr:cyclase dehydrase [Ophiostoma piceae UAMH 11346]